MNEIKAPEMPEYKGWFHWGEKRVGDEIHYKTFDPVGQGKKLW